LWQYSLADGSSNLVRSSDAVIVVVRKTLKRKQRIQNILAHSILRRLEAACSLLEKVELPHIGVVEATMKLLVYGAVVFLKSNPLFLAF
jgi:hypothetical protein